MGKEFEYFKNEKFDFYVGEEQKWRGRWSWQHIIRTTRYRRYWHGIIPHILDKRGSWERPQKKQVSIYKVTGNYIAWTIVVPGKTRVKQSLSHEIHSSIK